MVMSILEGGRNLVVKQSFTNWILRLSC